MKPEKLACIYLIVFFIFFVSPVYAQDLKYQNEIDAFYEQNDGDPLWISSSGLNGDGRDLLQVLEKSWENGLNPSKYNIEQISDLLKSGSISGDDRMLVELLLTQGYVDYIRDLSGMRIRARDMELDPKHWKQRVSAEEALSYLEEHHDDIEEFLIAAEPSSQTYKLLKSELKRLVEDKRKEISSPDIISFDGIARPGYGYSDIPKLRKRLRLDDIKGADRFKYDDDLVRAVMDFQKNNGLKPDGLIGKETLRVLNQTSADKINQIIVNMERLRWIDDVKPDRFIVVNIPSYTLWAIKDGEVVIEMPVIVGRKKRETPSFVTQVHGVRFNPTWTVPKTIKKEDILPKLQEDPYYLSDKGMELYEGVGQDAITIDPSSVDWSTVTQADLAKFNMVQQSGANNPLGRIRVLMPNQHNIYLHDTNEKHYFDRSDRAISSGCIRMKEPEKIAAFILESKSGWDNSRIEEILGLEKTKDVYTNENMNVYMLYQTVWVGDKMQIVYGYDMYERDKKLQQLLEKLDEFPILSNNSVRVVQVVD